MINPAHVLGQNEALLVECQQGFKLLPEVCKAFKQMQNAASQQGIDLQIVSSYRSFARQLQIWQNKWAGKTKILDVNEQPLDASTLTNSQKIEAILTWSALPGASRHHWGTDLDVYDKQSVEQAKHDFQLVCSEYDYGPCKKLNLWLDKYAEEFGFFRPYAKYTGGIAREPWHLSFKASAQFMQNQLTQQNLIDCLKQTDILGLPSILENMPTIYQRFVLNQGTTSMGGEII
ncbi:M15 family metallopeptidase [Paraglaciecola aestuariivivens]